MKKHIPVEFAGKSAEDFVVRMVEKRRGVASLSGKQRMDGIIEYMHKKGALSDGHLKKYEDAKALP
jgi:hypothetical protein